MCLIVPLLRSAMSALPSGRNAIPHGTSRLVAMSAGPPAFGWPWDSTSFAHATTNIAAKASANTPRVSAARGVGIQHEYPLSHSVPTVLATKTSPGRRNLIFKQFLASTSQPRNCLCAACARQPAARGAQRVGTGRIDDIAANIGRREPTDAPGSAVTDYHLCSGGRWQMTFALAIDR